MSGTYYVEPDYWAPGYSVDDYTPGLVLSSGVVTATSTVKAAGNYTAGQGGIVILGTGTVYAGGSYTQTFPGINLNAKSNTFVAASIISNSNGALSQTHSDVRMTGRPFWELTSPASGTWTTIVPQAEGTGK